MSPRAAGLCGALGAALAGPAALAQFSDVPYGPTPPAVVDEMLRIAGVGPGDYLIDLGSGDGRIVIAAAKRRGARAMGVELDGALVEAARREAERQGVAGRTAFHERNLFIIDIAAATVLTMYLYPGMNMQLRPRLLAELKPGTRVVSHEFDLGEWQPDARSTVSVPDKPYGPPRSEVYLWVVPAEVAGVWQWRADVAGRVVPYEMVLEQRFQRLEGRATAAGSPARLDALGLRGDELSFRMEADVGGTRIRHDFRGHAAGDRLAGTVTLDGGRELVWNAARAKRAGAGSFER